MKSKQSLFITVIFLCSISLTLFSQEKSGGSDARYLVDLTDAKISGFGATHQEITFINGEVAYNSGISGAFLFDYKFYAGIYSLSLNSKHLWEDIYPSNHSSTNPLEPAYTCNRVNFNHGGVMIGYIFNPNSLWHLNVSFKAGTGRIALYDNIIDFSAFEMHHRDRVGVITPEVDLELNLARWCKVSFSLGYRYVFGIDNDTFINKLGETKPLYSQDQFSSPTGSIKFHFGAFAPRANGKNGKKAND